MARNYAGVVERVAAAAKRAGRPPGAVRIVAVTKYARLEWLKALVNLGQRDLGESRPQQLVERAALVGPDVQWHLIGSLQRNKVRKVLPLTCLVHSVDSLRLLAAIGRLAEELDLWPRVLLEVNLTGEETRHGFTGTELLHGWPEIAACRHVRVEGLMTMAALSEDPETSRPTFAELCDLRELLIEDPHTTHPPCELSMGMSGDFEVAIEEGATLIRVGSALWEGLT